METPQSIGNAYAAKFSNLTEIIHPSIMMDRRFLELLEKAVSTGVPATRADVIKVFGHYLWED